MKILYHHRTQGRGVEAVHILGIVRAWQKKGYYVDILSPPGVEVSDKVTSTQMPSFKAKLLKNIGKVVPELIFEIIELLYNFWCLRALSQRCNKKSYDFIFERYALLGWAVAWYCKRNSIPLLVEINYTSHTPIYRKRSRIFKPLAHTIDKFIFRQAAGLIVVSSYLKEHLIELGVSQDKIIVLPNAVDPERFNAHLDSSEIRKKLNIENKKIAGFVGMFYPWHRVDFLVDSIKDVKNKIPDFMILFVGDGPTRTILEDRIKKEGLKKFVMFVGKVDHEMISEYIAAFDVAVVPHSNNYGSPMKIYEYMAMGKPVIAPDLGPLRDGIDNNIEGILFEPKNLSQLSEAFIHVLQDDKLCKTLGKNARRRIEKIHNWDCNAQKIINLFEQRQELSR